MNQNIPKDRIDFGEYVYIKHHDGISFTDYSNAPGEVIWNRVNFKITLLSNEGLIPCHQSFTTAEAAPVGIPIILDLDGDGVETTSLTEGAYFDHDANGFAEQTGWASSDDGLLTWDRNGDGIINDGTELFNDPIQFPTATNGFQVLAQLDDNLDGKIDVNDSVWLNLRIWQDYNGDGMISGKWEMRSGKYE